MDEFMIQSIEHPDLTKARPLLVEALAAFDAAVRPEIERLHRLMDRVEGEMRVQTGTDLQTVLADAQRHREALMRPYLELAALCPPALIIKDPNATNR
jgi:hypothetical protein